MGSLHEHNISLWVATTSETQYPRLTEDIDVDVAVIGAGIAGLSVATFLKDAGVRVAVIEAGRVTAGTTGYTTAKVTSLHELRYAGLVKNAGKEHARQYADANQAAVEYIARIVERESIDCEFRRAPAYTYTATPDQLKDIEAEVDAAQALGLPASFTATTELPYPIEGAVRFDNQAMFHPRKYCLALARRIPGNGSHVFEMTRATDVHEGETSEVITKHGTVRAKQVIVTTQIPFLDRGGFFAKTYPSRSYALAARINGPILEGMYLSADKPGRSVRPQTAMEESGLILGGEGHKVGQDPDTRQRYETLRIWAGENFDIRSIDYQWSAQDYMPVDNIPYIGKLTSGSDRILVATGFQKWGMTTGVVAGMILSNTILSQENPWAPVFDSTRVDISHSTKQFITENLNVAKHLVGDRIATLSAPDLPDLAPGDGGIVESGGEKLAAYRDESGTLHAVSPICTHLGCVISWNTAELTWDCPCHGSRYDIDGHVFQGPSVRNLERKHIPE